jgi:flagellar hook assembly protein FlgD
VRTLERAGGSVPLAWDGRDSSGRDAPTGIYLVRLTSTSGDAVKRLVKIQ